MDAQHSHPAPHSGLPAGSVGAGYAAAHLAAALVTAASHEDADTRRRAELRLRRWLAVLDGMATGAVTVGSRAPVAGLPAWATPEVVRGGFATGAAAAGGPLRPHERRLAERAGLPAERRDLFIHRLSEAGLAELAALLDSGGYRIEVAEEAALLVVAWLLRAGDRETALALLEELTPHADRLRFAPAPHDESAVPEDLTWRETAGEARERLAGRRPNPRVEAMREALTVWNPFADELLALWLETTGSAGQAAGQVGARIDEDWRRRGGALLDRYRRLAAEHTRCTKHRQPKENLTILRTALETAVAGGELSARQAGLLRAAVAGMLRRRGTPGSERHAALRADQAAVAAAPAYHLLARVVVARLATLPPEIGVTDVEGVLAPVRPDEADRFGVRSGDGLPPPIRQAVRRAMAGTPERLVAAGVVPSAEVLAELVPRLAAATVAAAYPDGALRSVVAAGYQAFRQRRSLLLLDLQHQVSWDELPWVRAVRGHRSVPDAAAGGVRDGARAALRRLGELALDAFPGTVLPNPLVRELAALDAESTGGTTGRADGALPWVEELAADIFEGRFSATFLAAAQLAGDLLDGSLYARYYGINYAAVATINDLTRGHNAATSATFDQLCRDRAALPPDTWSVAANGAVIEQAQILTTHNLATLVHRVGVRPAGGWQQPARRAFHTATVLAARLDRHPRPLATIKNIAYAWRHLVFFLSVTDADPRTILKLLDRNLDAAPPAVRTRIRPALAGLAHVAAGGHVTADGTAGPGRRLIGWTVAGPHWLHAPS
jgi:hypothetical protein